MNISSDVKYYLKNFSILLCFLFPMELEMCDFSGFRCGYSSIINTLRYIFQFYWFSISMGLGRDASPVSCFGEEITLYLEHNSFPKTSQAIILGIFFRIVKSTCFTLTYNILNIFNIFINRI